MEEKAGGFCGYSEEIDEITSPGLRLQRDEMDFIHEPRKCTTMILLALIRFAVQHDSFQNRSLFRIIATVRVINSYCKRRSHKHLKLGVTIA